MATRTGRVYHGTMSATTSSNVLSVPPATPADARAWFERKLACETDCSDVGADLAAGRTDFVLLDVRGRSAYDACHAGGAVSLPHAEITAERLAEYPPDTLFVVYCWGPGCNGATKAGAKLAALGRPVKEMLGGIHYWQHHEQLPVVTPESATSGSSSSAD
jgi:rhodanese-related sulfurtransferase